MILEFQNLPILPILSKQPNLDTSKFALKSKQVHILKTTYFNQIYTNVENHVCVF